VLAYAYTYAGIRLRAHASRLANIQNVSTHVFTYISIRERECE
jgi:hypothetical protein